MEQVKIRLSKGIPVVKYSEAFKKECLVLKKIAGSIYTTGNSKKIFYY